MKLFSYEFWILMGFFCVGTLTHAMYKFQVNTDPARHEDVCWNVIIQAVCLGLCLWSAECEKRIERKKDE